MILHHLTFLPPLYSVLSSSLSSFLFQFCSFSSPFLSFPPLPPPPPFPLLIPSSCILPSSPSSFLLFSHSPTFPSPPLATPYAFLMPSFFSTSLLFPLSLHSSSSCLYIQTHTHTYNLNTLALLNFIPAKYEVVEGETAILTITLSRPLQKEVTAQLSTQDVSTSGKPNKCRQ